MRRLRLFALLALLAGLQGIVPSAEAATADDVARARAQREAIQRRLNASVAAYEKAESELAGTQQALARAQVRLEAAERQLASIRTVLSKRANLTYRRGSGGLVAVLLEADGFGDFVRRLVLLEKAAGSDSAAMLRVARLRADVVEQGEDLARERAQERRILSRLDALNEELVRDFEEARRIEAQVTARHAAEVERRRQEAAERAARAARVARSVSATFSPGGFVCPVDGLRSYRDSWGERRSGGRRHQGVDIYAPAGTPVAAVVDGTILRMTRSGLGGITLYLRGRDGSEYFYAHLAGYAAVSAGQPVAGGTHIAFVGKSGNARGGPMHLHFEVHPGAGAAINPFPIVRAACG